MSKAGIMLALLAACLPVAGVAASGPEIGILIAVQNGVDGKPLAAPPTITAIVNQLGIESNLNLALKAYPWRRALMMAEHGEGIIYGAAATPERLATLSFSHPLYEVGQWLVVNRQRQFSFNTWDDLKGKVLAIQTGAQFMGEFEALRGTLFTVQENSESITSRLKMLALNRVDAIVLDSARTASQLETRLNCAYGDIGKWVVLDRPVSNEPTLLAVATASPMRKYLDDINNAISRLNQQGGVRKVVEQQQTTKPACP